MIEMFAAFALAAASRDEVPPEAWNCRNQVEVWCAADGCAASRPEEFTPMDIWASDDGEISVCAYTGCWEGKAAVGRVNGRLVWAGDDLAFSTAQLSTDPGAASADVSLMIVTGEGVGFVRAAGLATPVLCVRGVRGRG